MPDRNDDVKVYQDKKTKAEDYKSSAYTLLLVGVIGRPPLGPPRAGAPPVRFAGAASDTPHGRMGVLFVAFIVMGILSFGSSKRYAGEAADEEVLTERIKAWAKERIKADSIKKSVWFEEGTPDEMKYFQYFEAIKTAVTQEFGNVDASYLDALCEELYADIFEEK